jgi:hypothetical protein
MAQQGAIAAHRLMISMSPVILFSQRIWPTLIRFSPGAP